MENQDQDSKGAIGIVEADVIERIRRLELFSRFRVEGFMNGTNKSPYKGFTADFLQHRQYFPGDNLKYLDWRVYGKSERLVVRQYEELTNTRVSVILDISNSMAYQDTGMTKHDFGIRCAALIFHLAFLHKDSFSFSTFHTERASHIPFGSSKRHLTRIFRGLVAEEPGGQTNFKNGLQETTAPLKHTGLTIVLSDFMADADQIVPLISRFRFQGSDVIAMQIFDPSEREMDFTTITRFHDMEDNEILVVDPQIIQNDYQREFDAHQVEMKEACQRAGFDFTALPVSDDYDVPLMAYVRKRMELFS